ncbi:MAG: hypothetical protein A2W22_04870 [Candidatus Levybacteria bacterium RBG_16_35_11]|nr:MAG: hypothetical protein A2W22_04870 [Candidatus Levybacteria bacterium RBG_16_35_11]
MYLTKNQELELLSALDSRGESPLKFAYIPGYKEWINVAQKSREEHSIQFEEDLLKIESFPFIFREITDQIKTVNIIDFGCGDGVPILPVINYLKTVPNIRYIPVDISENMILEAKKTLKNKFPKIEIVSIISDFEKGEILEDIFQLTKSTNTRNYFFLLGNTLGNSNNTEKFLSNLKLSMFSEDSLIIGNQIANLFASSKFIKYYQAKEVYNLVTSTLRNYGMKCAFEEYTVRWNVRQKQIETFLTLREDKKITIASYPVSFEKGEEILLFTSKKFGEENLAEELNNVGFRIDFFATNKKKNTCIASVTPTRYKSE